MRPAVGELPACQSAAQKMRVVAAVTQEPSALPRRGGPDSQSLKNLALKVLQNVSQLASAVVSDNLEKLRADSFERAQNGRQESYFGMFIFIVKLILALKATTYLVKARPLA